MKLLYTEKYGQYKFYDMKSKIAVIDRDILEGYTILQDFLSVLQRENKLVYLPITLEVVKKASNIATKYGLLPNDALIAATCKHYSISVIATFDEDFKRLPWLKVIP